MSDSCRQLHAWEQQRAGKAAASEDESDGTHGLSCHQPGQHQSGRLVANCRDTGHAAAQRIPTRTETQ